MIALAPPSPSTVEPATPKRRFRRFVRGTATGLGVLGLLASAAGLVVHLLDTHVQWLLVLASAAWLPALAVVPAVVLLAAARRWLLTALAVVLLVVQVVVYAPLFVGSDAPAGGTTVQVMTQNLLYGRADAAQVVARVKADGTDLLYLQELTADEVARLDAAGLARELPYRVVDPRPAAAGTGLYSRWPISDTGKLAPHGLAGVSALVTLPGGGTVRAVSLHPSAPWPEPPADWYRDLDLIRTALHAEPSGPVLVGGDLNSAFDHAHFRALLTDGWSDGAEQAGAGFVRSWPTDKAGVPPVLGIDHVLTRGAVTTALHAVRTTGSDHMGLVATVVVPG